MARHVYLTDRHSPNVKPSWFGESIGHYENGDTLVVDTIGLNTRTFVDSYRTPHTEQLHVVERFRIVDGGKALEVNVHVEDPGAFTMPWNAMQRYRRVEQGLCREQRQVFRLRCRADPGVRQARLLAHVPAYQTNGRKSVR